MNLKTGAIREIRELVQQIHRQETVDADAVLEELTRSAVAVMPGADYAGVTVAARDAENSSELA